MLVQDWLVELGCEVVGPARSVQEGLDFAGKALIDAAILDVNLGGQNSYPVADALRQRGIPFAFVTGEEGIDPGSGFANPFLLTKPFDFDGVKAIIGKLLRS